MANHNETFSWKNTFQLNYRAFALLYKHYPQMVLSKIISVIWTSLTPYVGIYLSALILDELSGNRNPAVLKRYVLLTLISSAVIALVTALLTKWSNTQNVGMFYKCEQIFSKKLLDMDYVHIDNTKTHEQLSEIRQNMNGGDWGLYRVTGNYEYFVSSIFSALGGITLTISLFTSKVPASSGRYVLLNHPLFILAIILLMIAVTFLAPALLTKANSYWAKHAGDHNLGNRLLGYFGFLGYQKELATDVRTYRQDLFSLKYSQNKEGPFFSVGLFAKYAKGPMGLLTAASTAVSVIFTGIVLVFVCLKSYAGAFGVGMITQYIASITLLSKSISLFLANLGDMKNNSVFLAQAFDFLDIPNTMYKGSLTVEKRQDRDYEVEFKNVSFKYPNADTYALSGVNMKFKIGKRLAVVGMNGSGKTTFIKLLCRLYDPTEGEILLNGIDIRKYNYREYMMIFSIVFQDFKLFSLPLGENVASGSDVDKNLVVECLKKADFGECLAELKDGIDTYLYKNYDETGRDVSGGEAQKIAIARAIYKDSPFLILDEPTAALDPIAEAEIYKKFDEIAGDKTAIYISHRLSSCKFCDEIAVFDHGTVVQMGTHQNLVSDESGKYYELWNAQAQYYIENEA